MNALETAVCKVGHIYYAGWCECPECKIYQEADAEDMATQELKGDK